MSHVNHCHEFSLMADLKCFRVAGSGAQICTELVNDDVHCFVTLFKNTIKMHFKNAIRVGLEVNCPDIIIIIRKFVWY